MTDTYICHYLSCLIDKLIIYPNTKRERFLLHHLKDALTKSLFLLFNFIVVSKLEAKVLLTKH